MERLKAVPFATNCVDCQRKRNHDRIVGEGTIDEPFAHQWALPPEMAEPTEESHDEFVSISIEKEGRPRVRRPLGGDRRKAKVPKATSPGARKASPSQMSLARGRGQAFSGDWRGPRHPR
jgi:hypothetical protein